MIKFYAESQLDLADMQTFRGIVAYIDEAKEKKLFRSCHTLCGYLEQIFDVRHETGFFCGHYEHSWLITKSGKALIDAYPVAGAAPFIVSRDRHSPWIKLYTPVWFNEAKIWMGKK